MSEERDQVADEPIVDSAETVADEANAQGDDQDQSNEEAGDGQAEDDTEEIEHEGKKYRIPKAINAERLMQQDYTRKTQEVAESRKALEARTAEVAQQAEILTALRPEIGKVQALQSQLEAFDAITPQQWGEMYAEDPGSAKALEVQQAQVRRALEDAGKELSTKEQALSQQQQAALAKQAQETWTTLSKDIKGWSEPVARQVVDYAAKEFGVSLEDLRSADHRSWKLLHTAMTATAELAKLQAKDKTAQRQEKVAGIEPARTVGGNAGGYKSGLSDDLPNDEWQRRRNAQLAKR